ncbi:MAG: phosphatidate cytidylyltransferase [Sciscionella sp.]
MPSVSGERKAVVSEPGATPEPGDQPHGETAQDRTGLHPDGEAGTCPDTRSRSKAGRDLPAAIAVGLTLGAIIVVGLLTYRQIYIGIVALAAAVATWELAGALRRAAGVGIPLPPVLLGGQAMIWLTWPWRLDGLLSATVVTVLVCMVWRMRGGADGYLRDITAAVFTVAYVPLFAAFAAMLVEPADGAGRVLAFMICVVASDTGGYAAGALFGRHPMAPTISPKKSWEGLSGSMLVGIAGGVCSLLFLLHAQWWQGVILGVAVVLSASVGDLFESLIKRDIGVKDMGKLLPGHGGLMDRMDSLLPSAVVSWLLLSLFIPA